jgi:ribonuclease R
VPKKSKSSPAPRTERARNIPPAQNTRSDLVIGKIAAHPDGFGFLVPLDKSSDIFLGETTMRNALHGDTASVRVLRMDQKGKREGEIVDVLQRAFTKTVGALHLKDKTFFVVARDTRIAQDIVIPKAALGGAEPGQVVEVEITQYPSEDVEAMGRIVSILGAPTDDGIEIEIALRQFDLPYEWPDAVVEAEAKLPKRVRKTDLTADRVDLRDLPLVTIDGETAKDFDDAVYAEKKGRGFRLIVAIADVSHYVRTGDAIDAEGRNRSTSVYFPRRVIPMLPEALSNEMCSLKPEVDRLALICDMDVSSAGRVTGYTFYPAVIHSRARLTYTQVWSWLSKAEKPTEFGHKAVLPHVETLYKLYQALRKAREKRGAIDFESTESVISFDDSGKIERITPTERNDAHKLIEECMLAANECAAVFLLAANAPALYRNHEGPTPQKLESLREFLGRLALPLGGGLTPKPADYAELAKRSAEREDAALIHTLILRSMQQARYSPENVGHFGLAYDAYTHFTSPIRRYPDLIVHRAIKAALKKTTAKLGDLEQLAEHTSMCERRADDASRAVMNYLKCVFMSDKLGETFEGTVSGVQGFGLFVTLDGMGIDGLIHVTTLPRDYYKYDPVAQRLTGERARRTFQVAQKLRVVVTRVDMDAMKIEFVLDEAQ